MAMKIRVVLVDDTAPSRQLFIAAMKRLGGEKPTEGPSSTLTDMQWAKRSLVAHAQALMGVVAGEAVDTVTAIEAGKARVDLSVIE